MILSEKTKDILRKYGWTPERKVDTDKFVVGLNAEGYEVFNKVLEFLSIFGGLYLKMPQYKGLGWDTLHFDPIKAASRVYFENIQVYEKRTGEKLVPIGEAYNGYYILMLSESGKMYGALDNTLRLEGIDYEAAIETMYQCLETPEIP